ncbi:DNA primase [Methylobacterium sp. Leaf399]|uniref:DNA primase n=1 Tax=unclassified Methylobacterium TaxID=2615210 RepID=UPI0006F7B06E|nr:MULTISPECIES: DNA primase [unclassified Methylobacterium]KQP59103.1 DNA primase [Methylobacterium sp. Leaf108]KQT15373.1 DNA primase [Methylobacterium sp. Leaf399]KQT78635.1 DNA primase [Methylobacterium sp. Leaf466]
MRYPPHILEEIRARLPASDVVGRRVRLKKAGREWRGLSPFNAEKSPSFYVNDQKQFYHCFSSGKHGDVFTFLMETEGLSFPEAVERLASEAGVALPSPSADTRAMETKRKGAFEVMELAAAFFEEQLRGRPGASARAYLDGRGLTPEIRARFRLGYATGDRYGLRDHLAAKDVEKELMAELGLLVSGDDIAVPFDKFRDRIIFPITDSRGRVIAFGGRAMQAEAKAKYLNSPETPLFHKGQVLYNLHGARKSAHDRGTIVAVEGYVDVIAMTMAGHANAVAPMGTALTEEQLALLWRHADEPILCFDGDAAGQRAALRAIETALPSLEPGKSLRFALLPEGQDPDDLLRSGGPSAIDTVLAGARPLVEVLWSRALEAGPVDTPERRAGLAKAVRAMVAGIRDETVRRFYRDEIEDRLRSLSPQGGPARRRDDGRAPYQPRGGPRRGRMDEPAPSPRITTTFNPLFAGATGASGHAAFRDREAMIVASLLVHPELLGIEAEDLSALVLDDPDAQALRSLLLDAHAEAHQPEVEVLANRIERAGLQAAVTRLSSHVRPGDRWALDPHADSVRLEDALRQAVILHCKSGALNSELRQAERALAEDPTEANFAWLCDVKDRLAVIAGAEAEADVPEEGDPPRL